MPISFHAFQVSLRILGFLVLCTMLAPPDCATFARALKPDDKRRRRPECDCSLSNPLQPVPFGDWDLCIVSGDGGNFRLSNR